MAPYSPRITPAPNGRHHLRPYINLTLQLMRDFGAQTDWASKDCITVSPGGYTDTPFTVESDWSAASYWYQMMAIEGIKNEKIKMKGRQK